MKDILTQYYQGITSQLRSEVDFINTIFHHQGVKGAGNESALRDLVARYIPRKFSVGTGIVIDRNGHQSRQCDIVIYDAFSYPSLLSLASVHLFPVDIVYAVLEVKTTLNANSVREGLENIESVKTLDIISDEFMSSEHQKDAFFIESRKPTPPLGCIFAYNSDVQQFETYKNWFSPNQETGAEKMPALVGCLDQGVIYFENINPQKDTKPKACAIPLVINGNILAISKPANTATYEGIVYPVKQVKDSYVPIDQSRVFLFFMLLFSEMLSIKRINPNISFINDYLKPVHQMRIYV
jgi:hypothetical protein